MITWQPPFLQSRFWQLVIVGITPACYQRQLYDHEAFRGTIHFYNPSSQTARMFFADDLLKQYGATRLWWLVREDVLDANEPSPRLRADWEAAITDALLLDSGAWLEKDDWADYLDVDSADAAYGRLRWRGDDASGADDDDDASAGTFGWLGDAA